MCRYISTVYYLPVKIFIEFVPVRLRISLAETVFEFGKVDSRHQLGSSKNGSVTNEMEEKRRKEKKND